MNLPKTVFRRACVVVLLATAAFGASAQAAAPPVDPLVGRWFYFQDQPVTFNADGTVDWNEGSHRGWHGTWEYLRNPEVQRHYHIVWEQGKSIDDLALAEDGQRASVRNQTGDRYHYNARRAVTDKPAAASPAPTPSVAGPANVAPEKTMVPAKPADAADPVVGEWHWLKGKAATFLADGTVKSAGKYGTWEFLHNPETERKYRVTLSPGGYASDLLYDPATGTARATNTGGKFFNVAKAVATPDKPSEGYFGAPGR